MVMKFTPRMDIDTDEISVEEKIAALGGKTTPPPEKPKANGHDHQDAKDDDNDDDISLEELGIWNAGQDDYKIPPRQWLLGNIFCRKFLSSVIADGGTGKTALRVAQLISLAIGRSLTGEHVFLRCRVLIISLEDDKDELRRRVYAVARHYHIDPKELDGWLFLSAPKKLKLAEMKSGSRQAGKLEKLVRKSVKVHNLDIVSLDPFIKGSPAETVGGSRYHRVT
jgi:RecA-family ATPase